MPILLTEVTSQNQEQLIRYSAQYGAEHDASYLPGRDFELSPEYPAYLMSEDGLTTGAVCLMRTPRYLSVAQARFSIFHTTTQTDQAYSRLLDAARPHFQDLRSVFLFLPQELSATAAILTKLGFEVERYSFVLERDDPAPAAVSFPDGIRVQALEPADRDGIQQFCDCLNEEFSDLAGHTPNRVEELATWFEDETYLEGGLCLLKQGQAPIGTIAVMRDNENPGGGEILAFGIRKSHRGRNLGRNLFRYGVNLALERGLQPILLAVNAENDNALRLYLSEGFQVQEALACYRLTLS